MDELLAKIQFFLESPRQSDGGWAPVEKQDMIQLSDIIQALISAKWQPDADGDLPVEVGIVDRTRYEPQPGIAVRYFHKAQSDAERMDIIRQHMLNVRAASSRLDAVLRTVLLSGDTQCQSVTTDG